MVEAPKPAPAPLIRVYGIIKPTIIGSSGAVESYSQPNATAITAAGNPVLSNSPRDGRLTFQAGQSRLGVHVGEGTPYHAQIETDFLDFTKASPTVASVPRIRIAKLDWKPTDKFTLTAGQDWELAQPVNPHGMNLVGALFQAGNSAYMRQQVKALLAVGSLELGLAVGLRTNTNGAVDTLTEVGFTPTFSGRVQYNLSKSSKLGVSGIVSSLLLAKGANGAADVRTVAGMGGLYADVTFAGMNLRAEGYFGQNAANLYLLTLGTGRASGTSAVDIQEAGGFVSLRVPIDIVGIYGQVGGAGVLNRADVIPSYGYATGSTTPTVGAPGSGGNGIRWNMVARLGVDVKIWDKLNFICEGFWTRTDHALAAVDVRNSVAQAFGVETGFLMSF